MKRMLIVLLLLFSFSSAEAEDVTLFGSKCQEVVCSSGRITVAFTALLTEKTFTYTVNGVMNAAIVELPNFTTGTPTATFSIIDANSKEIYSKASLAENTDHIIQDFYDLPLNGTYTFKLLLSGAAGGTNTAYVTLYFKR